MKEIPKPFVWMAFGRAYGARGVESGCVIQMGRVSFPVRPKVGKAR